MTNTTDTGKTAAHSFPEGEQPFSARPMSLALTLMLFFVVVMVTWSVLAPLSSAVVAPGIVSVETHRKAVQHLEGGIIGRIHVKDGTAVKRGDVLIQLDDVLVAANVDRLKSQHYEAVASVARLSAERDGADHVTFPDQLATTAATDRVARNAMAAQRKIFDSRKMLQQQKLAVLDKQIKRTQEERVGFGRQLEALDTQFGLNAQENKDAAALFERKLIRKSRLTETQREQAQLEERRSALQASVAQNDQKIAELELRKSELQSSDLTTIVEDIRSRQARAHEVSRELAAAEDILSRTQVRAPIDGTVVGLQVHSSGGVIAPGQTLMEIVPVSDSLVVDLRVRPEDIEDVRAGLAASIALNTLTRRYSQKIEGRITNVSADRLREEQTGRPYYLVRVAMDPSTIDQNETKVIAGMSADVFIKTGERTPLAYLTAPLVRTLSKGMRER